MMTASWSELLAELQRAEFVHVAGTSASVRIPIADHWLSQVIAARIPPSVPIKQFALSAGDGNQFTVRIRLARPAFLPALPVRVLIRRQPSLPDSPVLLLQLVSGSLAALSGALLGILGALPAGIHLRDDTLTVDLRILAQRYRMEAVLDSLTRLEITTEQGRVIVSADAVL